MSRETLYTAARRLERFIRIDDDRQGGLLSIDSIKANMVLARQLSAPRWERESTVAEVSKIDGVWYVRFDQSTEAVEFGKEQPPLLPGDKVDIVIRKHVL